MQTREGRLGLAILKRSVVTTGSIGALHYDFDRKELLELGCHAFVSELSLCCCLLSYRRAW
jgi:hypothetical protein